MADLDDYLRKTLEAAKRHFPEAGFLLVAVADSDDSDSANSEITYMTNMCHEEMNEIVGTISGPEAVPVGASLH